MIPLLVQPISNEESTNILPVPWIRFRRCRFHGIDRLELVHNPRWPPVPPLRSSTYTLFRNAIRGERQVVCSYDGRPRELCPHIIGINKNGEEVGLAWQVTGETSG